jgi:hypothetical protein
MDMEDLMHDLYIGNFWGMTELFLEYVFSIAWHFTARL